MDETASFPSFDIDSIPGNTPNGRHCLPFMQSKEVCAIFSQRPLVEPKTWAKEIPSDVHVLMSQYGGALTRESRIKVTA
jgi:hypothetical protein